MSFFFVFFSFSFSFKRVMCRNGYLFFWDLSVLRDVKKNMYLFLFFVFFQTVHVSPGSLF